MKQEELNMRTDTGCPDHEFLSSYFDGELDKESPEHTHISACPSCRKELDAFARIGQIFSEGASRKCRPDLPEDMLKKVREKINKEQATVIPFPLYQFLKIAAAIVLVVGIFAYISTMNSGKVQVTGTSGLKTTPPSSAIAPAPPSVEVMKPAESATMKRLMPDNEIQFYNMSNASTGQGMEFRPPPQQGTAANEVPVNISGTVSHVWTVNNLRDASAELRGCATKLGIPAENVNVTAQDGDMTGYSMSLTKKQVSCLVKLFASEGNKLLSPAAPQPEQNIFYGNAADPVNYEVKLVQKGK